MYNKREIMETIQMIKEQNLDVRTITMGISLIDCMDSDINKSCEKVYNKIYNYAKDLVKTGVPYYPESAGCIGYISLG